MGATIDPAQAVAQCVEDTMRLPFPYRLPKSPATATNKEWAVCCFWNVPCTLSAVMAQCCDGTRMQGQLARLGELGLPDGQHPMLEIDILITQVKCLGDT